MALNSNDNHYLDFDYDNEKEQRAVYSLDNVDFNLTFVTLIDIFSLSACSSNRLFDAQNRI